MSNTVMEKILREAGSLTRPASASFNALPFDARKSITPLDLFVRIQSLCREEERLLSQLRKVRAEGKRHLAALKRHTALAGGSGDE